MCITYAAVINTVVAYLKNENTFLNQMRINANEG